MNQDLQYGDFNDMTHEQLISQCFQWHWNTFAEERRMLYAVNNNSANTRDGAKQKALGVVAGVFDLCYLLPGKCAYFDAKVGNDAPSQEQLDFSDKCTDRGHLTFFFSSLKEFQDLIYALQSIYMV